MAAPTDITFPNISGQWTLDTNLSNSLSPILALQGVSWFLRKALPYAKVTLHIHVYPNSVAPNIYHLDVDPVITGGIKGTKEAYKLDWIPREHVDDIFGTVNTKWRSFGSTKGDDGKVHPAVQVQTVLDSPEDNFKVQEFLNGIILADGSATEGFTLDGASKGLYIQGFVENKRNGWTSEEVWGFELVNGERRHTRRAVVAKDGRVEFARFVYSFEGRRLS